MSELHKTDLDFWCHLDGLIIKLTLKTPVTPATDDSLEYFSLFFRENKT